MTKHLSIAVATVLVVGIPLFSGCGTDKTASYDPAEVQTRQVKVGDIDISYREYGEGYPLVMLMGLSGTMDTWDPDFINELAKNNRLIMLDYRGFGKTDIGSKPITLKQYADDTAALMDALKIDKANVLGWSLGTYVAQEFALAYPRKTDKIVLYAADFGGEKAVMPSQEVIDAMSDQSGTQQEQEQRVFTTLFPADWLKDPKNQEYLRKAFGKYADKPTEAGVKKQWEA